MTETDMMVMISEALLVDPSQITVNSQKDEIPEWDSMGLMSIMAMIDDEFQITLSMEEAEAWNAVSDIILLLKKLGKIE